METLGGFTGVWTVSILLFCGFSPPWSRASFVVEDLDKKVVALYKVIDYIYQRPHQMNADVTLSVTIVEANVAALLLRKSAPCLDSEHRQVLTKILILCDATRRRLLSKITPDNDDVRLLHETINDPVLWMKEISWRRGVLEEGRVDEGLTYRDIQELVMQGVPQEEESDRCLAEIVRNKLNLIYGMPDVCVEVLTSREPTRGYPLTHRLLIVEVAKAVKRDQGLPSSELILSYCSTIFRDLTQVEAAGFPYQTADLTMEQVVLCGMEGFLEFTSEHYERLILSWAHPRFSCFSSFGDKFRKEARLSRRASTQTDFGCDGHATGLAAASLSLFIRANLETACG